MLTRVALQGNRLERREDVLDLGTQELGGRPQRVPVLPQLPLVLRNVHFVLFLDGELRAIEETADVLRDLNLPGMGTTGVMDEGVEGTDSADHGFRAHGRANLGEEREVGRLVEGEGGNGRGESGAVEDAQMLLGRKWDRRDPMRVEGGDGGHDAARTERGGAIEDADRRVADKRPGDVRER